MASENIKNNSRLIIFTLFLAVFFGTLIYLFSSISVVYESGIKSLLDRFNTYVGTEATMVSRQGSFTYGNIEVEGWGANRRSTIYDLTLGLAPKNIPDASVWSFKTMSVLAQSPSADPHAYQFTLPNEIGILENGQLKSTASFASAPQYLFRDGSISSKHVISQMLMLPSQITIAPAATANVPGVQAGQVVVSYDANPVVMVNDMPDDRLHVMAYEFHNLKIDSGTGDVITAALLSGRDNEGTLVNDQLHGAYTLGLADLVLNEGGKATRPYNIDINLEYNGNAPMVSTYAQDGDILIHKISITADKFSLSAAGKLATASGDTLPSGSIDVTITNVDEFLANEWFPEQSRQALFDLLKKITGNDNPKPVATITLKREKNGILYVGSMTFSDAYAAFKAALLPPVAPAIAGPQAPAAPVVSVTSAPATQMAPATQVAPVAAATKAAPAIQMAPAVQVAPATQIPTKAAH